MLILDYYISVMSVGRHVMVSDFENRRPQNFKDKCHKMERYDLDDKMNNKVMKRTADGKILITFISLTLDTITITYEENLEFLTYGFLFDQTNRSKRIEELKCEEPR